MCSGTPFRSTVLDPEDGENNPLRNVRNYLPIATASYRQRHLHCRSLPKYFFFSQPLVLILISFTVNATDFQVVSIPTGEGCFFSMSHSDWPLDLPNVIHVIPTY
jgi:hypothetical protein